MAKRDIIHKLQDYRDLSWNEKTATSGTGGTFLKARRKTSRGDIYYKLSCYDRYEGVYGHESVNELIASRLLDHLNAQGNEDPLEFCKKMGWKKAIEEMMAFDYLIINRDRHGANVEVILRDGTIELAPLFDHGVSLAYSCYTDEDRITSFDPFYNGRVNNYLGSRSLENNLSLVSKDVLQGRILADKGRSLFLGLDDVISRSLKDKLWEIISTRWQHLVNLGIAKERDQ